MSLKDQGSVNMESEQGTLEELTQILEQQLFEIKDFKMREEKEDIQDLLLILIVVWRTFMNQEKP